MNTNTIRLTMAQALVRFLGQQYIQLDDDMSPIVHGVFAIFGHGNVAGIGEALEQNQNGLRTYRGSNEQGMALSAVAYAKQLNRRAIIACTSSIGPGALNMVTAAGVATSNRIPLLLLPGDTFSDRQPDPVLQQIEHPYDHNVTANDAFKPVSKYWDRITRPEQLMTACLNAFRILTNPADTGAVTLCLPQDVQTEAYDYPASFFEKRVWHIERTVPSDRALTQAANQLKRAKHPLLILGGGLKYSEAKQAVSQFVDTHHIAFAVTQAGKGILPDSHPYNLGGIGTTGTQAANQVAAKADLIIALGTRLQDFTTASKWLYPHAQVIQINVNDLDAYKMNAIPLKGDCRDTITALSEKAPTYKTAERYQQGIAILKRDWQQHVQALSEQPSKPGCINQAAALIHLNRFLKPHDTIICAAGSLPGDLHRLWQSNGNNDYHLEYGFSCMGYEVAGGLGVALAKRQASDPGRAYVLVGDGSFLMMHSEIVTALLEKLSYTIVIFDNQGYQCIHNLQCALGSKGFATELRQREGDSLTGNYLAIDFAAYAQALGATVYQAESLSGFKNALALSEKTQTVSVISLKIDQKSMTSDEQSWWRVAVAQVSKSAQVNAAAKTMQANTKKARVY